MASSVLPATFQKLVAQRITSNFRKAVEVITVPLVPPKATHVIIKNRFAGVNATDVNVTAGRYSANPQVPFDVGLEGLGEVVSLGSDVKSLRLGQPVAFISGNAYSEYVYLSEKEAFPVPQVRPEFVSLLVSGLTASIGLDKCGEIKKGDVVLITAAAGGLGQIAVQWAKRAGCQVVGTCSSPEKEQLLKDFGCSEVINYKKCDLAKSVKEKYPDGIDVVWETLGGQVFETLSNRLAVKGRLVIIGATTGYKTEGKLPSVNIGDLPVKLLFKSASIRGFFVTHFASDFPSYFGRLASLVANGELKIVTDDGSRTSEGPFHGIPGIFRAVDYLQSGKSSGKVVVAFPQ